jgi:hypothetical protein
MTDNMATERAVTTQVTASIDRLPDYIFCADGSVISLVNGKARKMKPIQMGAYVGLQLRRADGTREKQYVHRLICEAFNGAPASGQECRHLNGDRSDNRAENLAWGSRAENEADKVAHGTSPKGERNPQAKLTESVVATMRADRAETGDSFSKLAAKYGVTAMTAYRAVTGQSWGEV